MDPEMYAWSVILFSLVQQIYGSSETHYECGAHGKFEYCIDKEPGCVVGCHCHPGYYFDTDTKVCEPNLKLTQFRRNYNLEPTRVSSMNYYESITIPTLTTTLNPVDAKVEEIAKDTDDLGDWLYNQFFKTIENQVINNTDSEVKTRRSGSSSPVKPKRRTRKNNKKSKKKKLSKKGLRSKLLRITEDDSLFDSSSSSSSDESDSSSTDSDSDSSDDHDHRKIVMINKKPLPPLPSFIFLPNAETPFYPPVGLPAPPIAPMYPMVPIPPMGIMFPGELTTSSCGTSTEKASTEKASTEKASTESPTSPNDKTTTTEKASTAIEPESTTVVPENLRIGGRSGQYDEFLQNPPNKNMGQRNKFLHKMREKMKRKNKRPHNLQNLMEGVVDSEPPPFIHMPVDRSSEYRPRRTDDDPKLEDVDFKYLSQLIHKMDLNKTEPRSPMDEMPNFDNVYAALTRKSGVQRIPSVYPNILPNNPNILPNNYIRYPQSNFQPPHNQRPVSKADDVNDAYFTNLGKQIASLIRKHEPISNREIDIEIQGQNLPSNMQAATLLSENSFAQGRSYWERFVRSPLKSYLPYMMQSGEDLISLENLVNMATATRKPLSLQELENIISIMDQGHLNKKKYQHHTTERTPATMNQLKFNLLPQMNRRKIRPVALTNVSDMLHLLNQEKSTAIPTYHYNNFVRPSELKVPTQTQKHEHLSEKSDHVRNNMTATQRNRTRSHGDINNINTLKNLLIMQSFKTPLHQQVSRIVQRNVTNAKPLNSNQFTKHNLNPLLVTYKNVNYLNNNHNLNKYHVQRSFLPYHLPIFKPTVTKTSYFHHELHHFDFFDK